jgi:hypothetical protein
MNAKMMAFVTTAVAVVAGLYVYNEFIASNGNGGNGNGNGNGNGSAAGTEGFAGRRRRR